MPLNTKTFAELFTYTRGSGATRVNAAGRIVGVDFSSTSNTVGTGSKTFTLTADLTIDRDWPVGSAIRAVDQVGGGTMNGTVTSYTASTQELVINVASITGSGTSTNWRIGSLEFRRDFDPVTLAPKGGLVEGGATNTVGDTRLSGNVLLGGLIRRLNTGVAPNGITEATEFENTTTLGQVRDVGAVSAANVPYSVSVFVKVVNLVSGTGTFRFTYGARLGEYSLNLATMAGDYRTNPTSGAQTRQSPLLVIPYPNGWFKISAPALVNTEGGETRLIFESEIGSIIRVWTPQNEVGSVCSSPIPTNGVQVTRAADQLSVGGANFNQFYNATQGTLVMELTPIAQAVGAVAGSLNDGTLNNAIRIAQKQSGTLSSIRKTATDGFTDVMAVNDATGNTLRSNGVDYVGVANGSPVGFLAVSTSGLNNFLTAGGSGAFRSTADSGQTYDNKSVDGSHAGAHFGIGRFVIAGATATINGATVGSVIVSTDGLAFRRVNISGLVQNLNEVTSNGTNQYVAVGAGGVIYTSPDAETWTAQTSGTTNVLTCAHWFGGRYVVGSNANNATRYSDNGTTWTAVTGLAANVQDVYHNGTNLWVAVGGGGIIYSSADGITWTSQTSGVAQNLNGVHFADGLWVAVGNSGTVVTSPDGTTWTDRTANSGTTQNIQEVNFFNGKFYYCHVLSGIFENTAANIVANVTWTQRSSNVNSDLRGIAHNGSRLLICGSSGAITTSEDGITFTSRTGNATTLNGAAFGNGTYVVVGNAANGSGLIATINPTTFEYQRRVSGVTTNMVGIKFLNGTFYAGTAGIIRSTDGISWVASGGGTNSWQDFAYSGSVYVAIGDTGRYSISTDGLTFGAATATGVTTQVMNGIGFANGLFVAVGNAGTIITSSNGTTWTLRTSGVTSTLHSVMYSTRDSQWYAAGDNGVILRSADAITWESIANDAAAAVISGGIVQSNPFLPNFIVGATNKIAMRLKANDFAASVNGADAVTDTSGGLPSANRFSIGMNGLSGQHLNAHIRKITYFPITKTDAELKGLST